MSSSPPYYVLSADLPEEEASLSTVAATVVGTGRHTLWVQGYSRLKTINGGYLESSAFMVGGHARICCYLNGSGKENAGFVSLFLKRDATADAATADAATADAADAADKESVVHAEFEFALVHHPGTLIKAPPHSRGGRGSTSAFRENGSIGYVQFIRAEDLKGSWFLKDDCFAVRCKVTVLEKWDVKGDARPAGTTLGKAFARFFGCFRG